MLSFGGPLPPMVAPSAPPVVLLAALVGDLSRPPSPFPSSLLLLSAFLLFILFCPSLSPSAPVGRLGFLWRNLVGFVWNGLLLGRVRGQVVPCRFCGGADGDGHLFWECTFPPLVEIRESPEFHDLMRMDKAHWPRCLLWHGWLCMLSGVNGASPWATSASESAGYLVEAALGQYSSGLLAECGPNDVFDDARSASLIPDHTNVWTDGGLVLDQVTLFRCWVLRSSVGGLLGCSTTVSC